MTCLEFFNILFLKEKKIKTGFYNAGFENSSILKIAKLVRSYTGAEIKIIKK